MTGTIDLAGNVGPIGGVRQKVLGAVRRHADLVLVPDANAADARAAAKRSRQGRRRRRASARGADRARRGDAGGLDDRSRFPLVAGIPVEIRWIGSECG